MGKDLNLSARSGSAARGKSAARMLPADTAFVHPRSIAQGLLSSEPLGSRCDRLGEGLRTPAGAGRTSGLRAGVRKPPKDERAGVVLRYGDLAAAARARRCHGSPRRSRPCCREPYGSLLGGLIGTRRRSWQAAVAVPGSPRTVPACLGTRLSDGRNDVASALCWMWLCRVTTPSSGSPSARRRSPGAGSAPEALDHEHAPSAAGACRASLRG